MRSTEQLIKIVVKKDASVMTAERCLLPGKNNKNNIGIEITIQKNKQWINSYILPAKFSCFFVAAKDAAYAFHLVLFLLHAGLDPAEAGTVCGLRLIGFIVGAPFWGYIADVKNAHRLVSAVLCVFSIVLMNMQLVLAYYFGNPSTNKCPHITDVNKTGPITPESDLHTPNHDDPKHNKLFLSMIIINIAASFFENSLNSFVDAGVVQRIRESPQPLDYGKQRLFDGFGAASFVLISSVASDNFPTFNITCYSATFFVYTFVMVCLFISTQFLFKGLKFNHETKNTTNRAGEKFITTLGDKHIIFFFFIVLWNGAEHALYSNFTFLYLKEIGGSNLLMGMCAVVAAISSTIGLCFSSKLIQLFGGVWCSFAVCCFSYFTRYLGTAYLQNPWVVLLLQPMNGLGYGLFVATVVLYVRDNCKPDVLTTMFCVVNALYIGFGNLLANSAGGQIYVYYGGRVLFQVAAFGGLICSSLVIFYKMVICKNGRKLKRNDSINKKLIDNHHVKNDIGQIWYFTSL